MKQENIKNRTLTRYEIQLKELVESGFFLKEIQEKIKEKHSMTSINGALYQLLNVIS